MNEVWKSTQKSLLLIVTNISNRDQDRNLRSYSLFDSREIFPCQWGPMIGHFGRINVHLLSKRDRAVNCHDITPNTWVR